MVGDIEKPKGKENSESSSMLTQVGGDKSFFFFLIFRMKKKKCLFSVLLIFFKFCHFFGIFFIFRVMSYILATRP